MGSPNYYFLAFPFFLDCSEDSCISLGVISKDRAVAKKNGTPPIITAGAIKPASV
jgi:hypothetical protein